MIGHLEDSVSLTSKIQDNTSINGSIDSESAISGKIEDAISIKGNITNNSNINGVINTNDDISGVVIIGDTTDANATPSDILDSKTAYVKGVKLTGIMVNNEPTNILLQEKDEEYTIPQGYHSGTAKVGIDDTNITSANIKHDVSILGITGSYSGDYDISDTTATANTVEKDKVFYSANGTRTLGTYEWDWRGSKPEFLQKFYNQTVALKNTDFDDWEASTTATSMKATENITTFSADMTQYEYLVRWQYRCDFEYLEGVTTKAIPLIECTEIWQTIFKRPSNLTNLNSGTFNGNACVTLYTSPLYNYRNTSGNETMTYSNSYGVYPSVTAHTFSSSTSDTPTVTLKTPAIYARCNSSYFATARKAYVDNENTKYHLVGELYRIPKGGTHRSMYGNLVDTYND